MDCPEIKICSLQKEDREKIYPKEATSVKSIIFVSNLQKMIFFHINDDGTFFTILFNFETEKVISKNCSKNILFKSFPDELRKNLLNFFLEKELNPKILKEWEISKEQYVKIMKEYQLSLKKQLVA